MRKLSVSLKESRFVDLINRKFTGERRKEDINLQRLEPVDIGTSVLWADNDLCVDDKYLFTFDEVTDILKDSEWRLPTVSEVEELKNCEKYFRHDKYIFTKNDKSLTFYPHGFINPFSKIKGIQYPDDEVDCWTADVYPNDAISIYFITSSGRFNVGKYPLMDKNCLMSVRLVKDR